MAKKGEYGYTGEEMDRWTMDQINRYLKNCKFPVNKRNLIQCAERNNTPEHLIKSLNKVSDKNYTSTSEIEQEFENW